jgi:hypothetical protein
MVIVFSEPTTAKGILFYGGVSLIFGDRGGGRGTGDLDLGVESAFFLVEFVVVVGIHFKVVEGEFCFNLLLTGYRDGITRCLKAWRSARVRESDLAMTGTTLTTSDNFFRTTMSIGLRLECQDIQREEIRVARGLDEEQTAVNTCVLDVSVTLSGEFFPEVGRVLILDVLDNRIPAICQKRPLNMNAPSIVVDLVAISGCIDDIET